MAAAYDTYDYPSYWIGREYEHGAEIIAIKAFLEKLPIISSVIDVGAGFGRLVSSYIFRANKVTLVDPSAKLLKLARKTVKSKKVKFTQSTIENLNNKTRRNSADLAIMIRVLHHINDIERAFSVINKILNTNGYFILEFANKRHLKATISQFLKGNLTFPLEIFPEDRRSKKSRKEKALPFINYHPDIIKQKLKESKFDIIEVRSVSNIRSPLMKKLLPTEVCLAIEKNVQQILAKINFGPSIFILAQKKDNI